MNKTIFVMTLCSAISLPALAHGDDAACVPTNSATGDSVYYTPSTTVTKETKVTRTRPHQRTAAENRRIWLREHTPTSPVMGNMGNAAGTSAIGYLHGTDNPQGHLLLNSDEGPSARPQGWDRSSAYDTSEDEL